LLSHLYPAINIAQFNIKSPSSKPPLKRVTDDLLWNVNYSGSADRQVPSSAPIKTKALIPLHPRRIVLASRFEAIIAPKGVFDNPSYQPGPYNLLVASDVTI